MAKTAAVVLASWWLLASCQEAFAYRPFDGTDAAVADAGEAEVELGPAEYMRQGPDRLLVAPDIRLNFGFTERWEAVLEGNVAHGLSADTRGFSLAGNGAFLKGVLRDGTLQDKSGPSIATELGVLLPGVHDEPGTGGSVGALISQQWPLLTVHFNIVGNVTRQQHGDLFTGTIIEGPHDWTVRPATEIFYERDFGGIRTTSALIGAIWQISQKLAFDAGVRAARINDRTLRELRAGMTFAFGVSR